MAALTWCTCYLVHMKTCATCGGPLYASSRHPDCLRCRHKRRQCPTCTAVMRADYQFDQCRACRGVCSCGGPKDYRVAFCRPCTSTRTTTEQWADPVKRARMHAAIPRGPRGRRRYGDLTAACFAPRPDGRYYASYATDDDRYHHVYRAVWVWEHAHGPVPDGHVIHHIDHVPWHDALDNLACIT